MKTRCLSALVYKIGSIAFIVFCTTFSPPAESKLATSINTHYFAVGNSITINTSTLGGIRVQGPKIIQIQDRGRSIQVTGLKPGEVTIHSGARTDRVVVAPTETIEFFNSTQSATDKMLGLKVDIKDNTVTLIGHCYRLSDWQAIARLAKAHNQAFRISARVDEDVQIDTRKWLQDELNDRILTLPTILFTNPIQAILSENEKASAHHWEESLQQLGLAVRYEKSELAVTPLVRVRIFIAEINKSFQTDLGVAWPTSVTAQVLPHLSGPDQIEVMLKAMERKGLGQILASPNLLTKSGSEADFLAGGEFGIRIKTPATRDVIWKKHGIYLKMKPTADRSGRLNIELTTEISIIDQSQNIDGIPGLKTNRMATHFNLTRAQTIVLSGLIRQDWGENREGLFALSHIPVLGKLFSSENFLNNKTELVIFVSPEIVNENDGIKSSYMPKNWKNIEQ